MVCIRRLQQTRAEPRTEKNSNNNGMKSNRSIIKECLFGKEKVFRIHNYCDRKDILVSV